MRPVMLAYGREMLTKPIVEMLTKPIVSSQHQTRRYDYVLW